MRKIVAMIIALMLLHSLESNKTFAQGYDQNLKKYWYFRYKLVNDFMKIGDQCGQSIPAASRHMWTQAVRNEGCHLSFGDATIGLGRYIGILATEYQLLKDNNLDTKRTLYELYYALKAFDRLDRTAEERCRNFPATQACQNISPQEGDLNGFFIRDDVPLNFVASDMEHFNRPRSMFKVWSEGGDVIDRMDGQIPQDDTSYPRTWINWNQKWLNVPQYPVEMSQDQVAGMYLGLSLATHHLTGTEYYNTENLKSLAQNALMRMSYYCAKNGFIIRNPLTNDCVYGIYPESYHSPFGTGCDEGGAMIFPSSPAITEGLTKVGANWNTTQQGQLNQMNSIASYHLHLYQSTKYFPGNSNHFTTTFTAIAKSWRLINFFGVNVSREYVNKLSFMQGDRWPHLPLVYRILHGGGMPNPGAFPYNHKTYEELFDLKPKCGNFYRNSCSPAYEEEEWSMHRRLSEYDRKGYNEHRNDEGNDLDYMLLFNLYLLNKGSGYAGYYNNTYYQENLNKMFFPSNPIKLNFLEYVGTTSRILSGADVTIRGAKEVVLKPGFQADNGSSFRAFTEDFGEACSNASENCLYPTCVNPQIFAPSPGGSWYAGDNQDFGNGFNDFKIPEDTVGDYEASDEEMRADSIYNYEQVINSGDSLLINYLLGMNNPDNENRQANKPLGINTASNVIDIFPNPTSREITVKNKSGVPIREIIVFNITGQQVLSIPNVNLPETRVDLKNLAKGTYILKIRGDSTYFRKVLLE